MKDAFLHAGSVAIVACATGFGFACALNADDGDDHHGEVRLRRPVALVLAEGGKWLFTANRHGGSISTIDLAERRTIHETDVGRRLVDLTITLDERHLLAVDQEANELIVLARDGARVHVISRTKVAAAPTSVAVAPDGRRCFVGSLWSRTLSTVEFCGVGAGVSPATNDDVDIAGRSTILEAKGAKHSPSQGGNVGRDARPTGVVDLPFPAGKLVLVKPRGEADAERLIVADAFGSGLAVLDAGEGKLLARHTLPGHNIRGLALSSDGAQLLVAHQSLNGRTATNQGNVFWGAVMSNIVRAVPLDAVLAAQPIELPLGSVQLLGGPGSAAGDPGAVAATRRGDVLVALAGVGELALRRNGELPWNRIRVGRQPAALVLDPTNERAYVANEFSDSVTVVSVAGGEAVARIALGSQRELNQAERGEMLFYDARLSLDGWFSCHSCHTDGHTNGLTSDTLGDGSFGAAKRVPSLLGTADTAPWGWNGGLARLEDQVRKSLETTMRSRNVNDAQVEALTAYVRSLKPPPPAATETSESRGRVDKGRELFQKRGCVDCHAPPAYTSAATHEVGLKDELGQSRFNPPSLRGAGQRTAFFHDNRAATLEDVFGRHGHPSGSKYEPDELETLLSFLRSL